VQPLFIASEDIPERVKEANNRALDNLDRFCRGEDSLATIASEELNFVQDETAWEGNVFGGDPAIKALQAVSGAVMTACEAESALRVSGEKERQLQRGGVFIKLDGALTMAARAADQVRSSQMFIAGETRDMEILLERAAVLRWTDETGINPDSLGTLWPDGEPKWWIPDHWIREVETEDEDNPTNFVVVWDPDIIDEDQYARIVKTLGDVVRESGGLGVQRIGSQRVGLGVSDWVKL